MATPTLMESLRVRVGLTSTDTTKDDEITVVKDTSFAMMGNYCDRLFPLLDAAVEKFTHHSGFTIQVKRFPIDSIASIVDADGMATTQYHFDAETGTIYLDFVAGFHQGVVTFKGGYDEDDLPPDLLMAFYSVFDQEWELAQGGTVSSAGQISSVTVQDVGTVRYTTDSSDGGTSYGDFLPPRAKSLLASYMRFQC
jgi:hypothetical protein